MFGIFGFFLLFILAFILILVLGVISVGWSLIRSLFGFGRKSHTRSRGRTSTSWTQADKQPRPTQPHRKIFDKDEGEYVDFEEVNE